MSTNKDGRNEWIALAECHFEDVKCQTRCIDIMEKHGMLIKGKTYIPALEESAKSLKSCIEMVVQYSRNPKPRKEQHAPTQPKSHTQP